MAARKTSREPKYDLTPEECEAVRAELVRLTGTMGSKRAVGAMLGYPARSDSQSVERAIRIRPGRETADRLYAALKTTREVFLATHGAGSGPLKEVLLQDVTWASMGVEPEGRRRILEAIHRELDAMKAAASPPPRATDREPPVEPSPSSAARRVR